MSKVKNLQRQLLSEFDADEFDLTSESTPGISGWLEVTINGKLVHSKKTGDGYIDNDKKLKKIITAIEVELKA